MGELIPLLGAAYAGRGLIASAQRSINLYAESNQPDPQSPVPVTYHQTPGSAVLFDPNNPAKVRCTYRTSIGTAYVVVGTSLYFMDNNGALSFIGFVADRPSQIIMADNGISLVIVDGTSGYAVEMSSNRFGPITNPAFYGATFVVLLDTFYVFNRPGTNQFYISASVASYGMLTDTGIDTGTIVGGASYTDGTYTDVPLTGGSGVDAEATITVAGNAVTVVDITNPGANYLVGDILSADDADLGGGGGAGFTYTITVTQNAFDPLDIAAKSGNSDPIVGIATVHKELWLIGELTSEVWIGTGAADFYFQQIQGTFIDHGCAAAYSITTQDVVAFWLMQDKNGNGTVVRTEGHNVKEISTPAIVADIQSYTEMSDAIGFCFQKGDHTFYVLAFPEANKTWLYDLTTDQWCEWNWIDENGNLNRHRANCGMFAYGKNIVGDWENGIIYYLSDSLYQDFGGPITRIRTFPHMIAGGNVMFYDKFQAYVEVGTTEPGIEGLISLRASVNKGKTYGNPIIQSLGSGGNYDRSPTWWKPAGISRDCVFEVSWSNNAENSLNGAFIEASVGNA